MRVIAAPNGERGVLRPVHLVRELTFSSPVAASPDAVLRALADELRRLGNDVVRVLPDRVEFYADDPPSFLFELRRGEHLPVSGGIVSLDANAPGRLLRVETWISPRVYVEPLALAAIILITPMQLILRATLLAVWLGLAGLHYLAARKAYESRIVAAARRASCA